MHARTRWLIAVGTYVVLLLGWGATTVLLLKMNRDLRRELLQTREDVAQGKLPRSVELDCSPIGYAREQIRSIGGPGVFVVSCLELRGTESGAEAVLQVGNPYRLDYHRLSVLAEWPEESHSPLFHFLYEPRIEIEALAAGAWVEAVVPIAGGEDGGVLDDLFRTKVRVSIGVRPADLPSPSD